MVIFQNVSDPRKGIETCVLNATRSSCVEICLISCHSVCPAASRSREQAFYWPLRKHRWNIPLLLMFSFFILTVCYSLNMLVLVLAIADMCHLT